ncbi:hypothetical protein PP182_01855 [Maribacter sp. PR1]|uniref:NIPSNAP domain-containing protein n=1 Tax=Maribacter cobaltidurans TaxID=1178778 RepID=A0ABU7IPC8_9FLAO|nr:MULTISPECIES: hypothetical protein [Maribacter]MDC6387409.1 hypothetical protein [Maribacter sp. PR1]MEE1974796.1 hypothetical protein [Maribacter cobaltidurans]
MKKVMLIVVLMLFCGMANAQEKLYLVFEFMKVDNEQETAYSEVEEFWQKIQEQRVKGGDILGWDLWALSPGGEMQDFQYVTVSLYSDPVKMMDGSSWSNLMDRAKAAYPNMSGSDLMNKLNSSAKTRDLAVRIYAEEILTTTGTSAAEMVLGTIAEIDMMKVDLMSYGTYEKAEAEVFQPLHQKSVDAGDKNSWGLIRFINPIGSDTYASHMTVSMFKDYKQALNQNINYEEGATPANTKLMQEGIAARDMKYVYMAELIRMAR